MKKKLHEECYLCGKMGVMTLEHVPPKNLSPKSPRSDFKFVPACSRCNNIYASEESKFRDLLVLGAKEGLPASEDAFEAMKRNFQRNDLGRAGRPHKDFLRLIQNIEQRDFYSANGLYIGSATVMKQPQDVNVQAVLLKIACGLHYLAVKTVIPQTYLKAAKITPVLDAEVLNFTHYQGNAGDFFYYAGGWTEDRKSGLWCMEFYQRIQAIAMFVCPPNLRQ